MTEMIATDVDVKRCGRCREVKPLDDFYRNSSRPDGHHGHCKACHHGKQRPHSQGSGQLTRRENQTDRSWQDRANCLGVDPDLFFPERGASTREAKQVCRCCQVREECLDYAMRNVETFGIWGGMSDRERRRLRRQRNQGTAS